MSPGYSLTVAKTRTAHRIHPKSLSFISIQKWQRHSASKESTERTASASTMVPCTDSVPVYVLLRELLFPGPATLGSLVALGWRGILWMGPSRLPRSATMGTLPRVGPPLFLPRKRLNTRIRIGRLQLQHSPVGFLGDVLIHLL